MTFSTVHSLVLRNLFLYPRIRVRLVELVFWPLVDFLVCGCLTVFLLEHTGDSFPYQITLFTGVVIFWDILFHAQRGNALYFLEDALWRNLLNVFSAPGTNANHHASIYVIGFLRAPVTSVIFSSFPSPSIPSISSIGMDPSVYLVFTWITPLSPAGAKTVDLTIIWVVNVFLKITVRLPFRRVSFFFFGVI